MNIRTLVFSLFLSTNVCAETLDISSQNGLITFKIELAKTLAEQQKGLMFRDTISSDTGMLFLYSQPKIITMWMKNTKVSLDMLFINQQGFIIHIHEKAKPLSLDPIKSPGPCVAVLEIAGGRAKALNLKVGDRIHHPAFQADK